MNQLQQEIENDLAEVLPAAVTRTKVPAKAFQPLALDTWDTWIETAYSTLHSSVDTKSCPNTESMLNEIMSLSTNPTVSNIQLSAAQAHSTGPADCLDVSQSTHEVDSPTEGRIILSESLRDNSLYQSRVLFPRASTRGAEPTANVYDWADMEVHQGVCSEFMSYVVIERNLNRADAKESVATEDVVSVTIRDATMLGKIKQGLTIWNNLTSLSLAGFHMSSEFVKDFCSLLTVQRFPILVSLDLTDTGLGANDSGVVSSLAGVLQSHTQLKSLLIGQNSLKGSQWSVLCLALAAASNQLQLLDISGTRSHEIQVFCLHVRNVRSLRTLNMRNCNLDDACIFILGDSLRGNTNISNLNLDDNPSIGQFGLTCIYKFILFRSVNVSLRHSVTCGGLNQSNPPAFSFIDPSNTYSLALNTPLHVSVLRQCLHHADLACASSTQTMAETLYDVKLNGANYVFEKSNDWQIPPEGTLTFIAIYRLKKNEIAMDPNSFKTPIGTGPMPHAYYPKRPMTPHELSMFMEHYHRDLVNIDCRTMALTVLSAMFKLSTEQVVLLTEFPTCTASFKAHAVATFIEDILDPIEFVQRFGKQVAKAFQDARTAVADMHSFCGNNPTGFYSLNLAKRSDRLCAVHLMQLNRFDLDYLKASRGKNISRISHFSKELLNGKPFTAFPEWQLPLTGTWTLFYVSPHRFAVTAPMKKIVPPIADADWEIFCAGFRTVCEKHFGRADAELLGAVQAFGSQLYMTSSQLVQLLRSLQDKREFVLECLTVLSRRLLDYQNFKATLIAPSGKGAARLITIEELRELESRLGLLSLLNPLDASSLEFTCNLSNTQERILAQMIYALQAREKKGKLSGSMIGSSVESLVEALPPKSWKKQFPSSGVWKGVYVGESGKGPGLALRKKLALQFCDFDPRTFLAAGKKSKK